MISSPSSTTAAHPSIKRKWEINSVSSDILRSHILTRLDGASLAALSCTCSNLHSSCSDESLWREKCYATWPSLMEPRVQSIISTFPNGHLSFFSDSFPFISHGCGEIDLSPSVETTELISAVDVFYKHEVIFSRVQVTETVSGWFLCSPMRVDLVEPKESILTRVSLFDQCEGDTWKNELEENLSLSWILIDPTGKRAADISTWKPISVHRHWLTGEVHVRFSTIFSIGDNRSEHKGQQKIKKKFMDPPRSEQVEFTVTVVLEAFSQRGEEKAAMQIREISLVAEDIEGRNLGGRDSLVILAAAMGMKRRRRRAGEEEVAKEKYKEFMRRKMAKIEMKCRSEKETAMETVCLVALALLAVFLCFCLFIHKNMVAIIKKLK